jgi:dethiobiotin synthase
MKAFVIAGIGTGVGKTLVSAIVAEALQADYWKPVQAGNLDYSDTDFVYDHLTNKKSRCIPEAYRLKTPMSPHAAAAIDGVQIELDRLSLPQTKMLVTELAGGLMVPLNESLLNIDLIRKWNVPVILVSMNYLGSINHTLLSVELLKQYKVKVTGIIFNGDKNETTENFIKSYTGLPVLANVDLHKDIDKQLVRQYAEIIRPVLEKL